MPISPSLHARPARPARSARPARLATAVAGLLVGAALVLVGVSPAAAAVLAPPAPPAPPVPLALPVPLAPPVTGPVVATFDAPTRYGPGHRGVDLAVEVGTPVRASAAGTVTFAGRVVDAIWVTVDHGAVRTTVGPLGTVAVQRGQRVARGTVVGTSGRAHGRAAVHWSLRRGDIYLDPLAAGRRVATLLPDRPGRRDAIGRRGDPASTRTRPTTSSRPSPHWRDRWVRGVR